MGLHDECGVAGVFGSESASSMVYFGLCTLQHRGQESAGIAVSNGTSINIHKNLGLVSDVFHKESFEHLQGSIAIGHVRYATAGGRGVENAQPFLNSFKYGELALAHNGQLVNHASIREQLQDAGSTFSSESDSEVILKLIVRKLIETAPDASSVHVAQAVVKAAQIIKGSFALCVMTHDMLLGARDPNGIRPLCLGKTKDGAYILASESCAIDAMNGDFVRDVQPGELVVITKKGIESFYFSKDIKKKTCIFEYVYFARPDSVIDGISVQEARYRMGEILAQESSVKADVVVGVPDSGIGSALGYARASGIPYVTGIVKNKYIGRTFIAPTQKEREQLVFVKLNAIKSDLEGKRVIVIDDSIVRGTTSHRLVQILRRAGAKEVHFRVSSPPVKFPCYLGIDTPSKNELISSTHELKEICKEIGADSLEFISLEGMIRALGESGFCEGCFCGTYPVEK